MYTTNDLSEHLCQMAKIILDASEDTLGDGIQALILFMPTQAALDLDPDAVTACGMATKASEEHTKMMLATLLKAHGLTDDKPLIYAPDQTIQ